MQFITSVEILVDQVVSVLNQLIDTQYRQPVAALSNASVGQHVRHIIEVFQELQSGYEKGIVNYDNRKRDSLLETNCHLAIHHLLTVPSSLIKEDRPLLITGNYTLQEDQSMLVSTTYFRELIYCIDHTVHHIALIKVALQCFPNVNVPDAFGLAFSTIRHQQACAQ